MAKKGWTRPPMTRERFKNQFRNLVGNPFNVIVMFTLILLFALIVIPLLVLALQRAGLIEGRVREERKVA